MSAIKRRQVIKQGGRQTQLEFPQQKNYLDQYSLPQDFLSKIESQNFAMQNGAKNNTTPFRSLNRVKNLLCQSPGQAKFGASKIVDSATQSFLNKVGSINYESKPSSVTTACTIAPSEYSATKSDFSKGRKNRDIKKDKKAPPCNKGLVGTKRPAQTRLDEMEYFLRLNSRNAKLIASMLRLRDKKTGQTYVFPLFQENSVFGLKASTILQSFDMSKLEVEYDYDTDCEQFKHSKDMLWHELVQAIDFFIKDDPLKLVDNVLL